MTEPDAGSDLRGMRTRAVRDGDGWRITGTKHFISHAQESDFVVLFAVTDESADGRKSLSAFLVDLDAPGLTVHDGYRNVSHRGYTNAILDFDDVAVPADALWGRAGVALADRVDAARSPAEALAALQQGMLARRFTDTDPDPLVTEAVRLLMPGRATGVAALPGLLAVSERSLRRRCQAAVGIGPKALHRTLRFQGFLARAQLARGTGRSWDGLAELAIRSGYADQAHLTRECVRLTGTTPRVFLGETADACVRGHDHAASYQLVLAGSFNNSGAEAS
jgi:AraC-like DNA-binding protein